MKYKGKELKEITTLQVFDPPKKMLVWWFNDDSDIPEEKIVTAIVKTTDGIRTITSDLRNYPHCAEIPEEPKSRRATNRELARWLAQGNGQVSYFDEYGTRLVSTSWTYISGDLASPTDEVNDEAIRKWDDTDWHEPTVDYMGMD